MRLTDEVERGVRERLIVVHVGRAATSATADVLEVDNGTLLEVRHYLLHIVEVPERRQESDIHAHGE